jgi:hypothetical protein
MMLGRMDAGLVDLSAPGHSRNATSAPYSAITGKRPCHEGDSIMGVTDVVLTDQLRQWTSSFTGINTKVPVIRFTRPRADAQDPTAITKWIEANVPCFYGPVSKEWEDAVWSAISNYSLQVSGRIRSEEQSAQSNTVKQLIGAVVS